MDKFSLLKNSSNTLKPPIKKVLFKTNAFNNYLAPSQNHLNGNEQKTEGGMRTQGFFKYSFSNKPLITVITVVFNCEKHIEKTILSIIKQPYDNMEYIIVDGGSTDRTLDIIRKYEYAIDYWISEKDHGIYDAMNKGISLSSGEGLLFINAGDFLIGDVLTSNFQIPCFYKVEYNSFFSGKNIKAKIKSHRQGLPIPHQGILFESNNIYYDETYKIASDYDFFLAHKYTASIPTIETDGYIYYDNGGYSQKNIEQRDAEIYNIIKHYFGKSIALNFMIKSFLFRKMKKLFGLILVK